MPLTDCPDCGRAVSSQAPTCPGCGYPLSAQDPTGPRLAVLERWKDGFSLAGRVVLGMILVVMSSEGVVEAGVIAGLLIAASSIPAFFRMRMDRLRAGQSVGKLPPLQDRLADLEHRLQEQVARLEDSQTGRLAELEERMDFTERLLTKPQG